MKIVDRYIFRQLVGPFLSGFVGAMVIVTFGNLLKAINLIAEGRVDRLVVLQWFIYRGPEDMQYIFPVGILLSTLLVFGRLSTTGEITALRAAGVSLARLTWPVAFFGAIVTLGLYLFLDRVVPPAMYISQKLWVEKIRLHQPDLPVKEHLLLRTGPGQLIYVRRYHLGTHAMDSVLIREYSPDGRSFLTQVSAAHAQFVDGNRWNLIGARRFTPANATRPDSAPRLVVEPALTVSMGDGPSEFEEEERQPEEMSFAALLAQIRRLEDRGLANTVPLKVELYLKTSFPFCVVIFAVIGTAMGLSNPRSGGFIGFGMSLLITFLYYVVMSLTSSLGKTGVIPPLLSAWIQNIVFGGVAAWLVVRVQS